MTVNQLSFQEGSEIVLDAEIEVFATGWTPSYVSVIRTGPAVQLHIEAAFAHLSAGATVCQLPAEYAPAATVTTPDGKFTLASNGTLSYTGSMTADGSGVAQLNYAAGSVSP